MRATRGRACCSWSGPPQSMTGRRICDLLDKRQQDSTTKATKWATRSLVAALFLELPYEIMQLMLAYVAGGSWEPL